MILTVVHVAFAPLYWSLKVGSSYLDGYSFESKVFDTLQHYNCILDWLQNSTSKMELASSVAWDGLQDACCYR